MPTINPYLNFPGNTEEAFTFYKSVFGGEFIDLLRYRDFGENTMGVPESAMDKIAHVALPVGRNNLLMATDALESQGRPFTFGNNFYIAIEADSAGDCERIFGDLSVGGQVEMPLERTEWAEKYGICVDRFGVQWMLMYTGSVQFSPRQESGR